MKLHLPLSLRKCILLLSIAAAAAPTAWAGTMHSDVEIYTYMDFGQNRGRYVVGSGVNALLSHIRNNVEQGIAIHYTDGTPTYTISNEQGMINYTGVHDGGYAAAIAPNYIATVAHNGEIDGSFGERVLGADQAINYAAVGIRSGYNGPSEGVVFRLVATTATGEIYDYMVQRQTKIFTDIAWNPITSITDVESQAGEYQYHAGGGSMHMWSETDGKYHFPAGYTIGSIKEIETATSWGNGNFSVTSSPNYGDGVGATIKDPLPVGTEGGDSGSPVFIYNAATGQYEYIAAHQSGGGSSGWAQARGNVEWTTEALQRFNVSPDMSLGEVYLHAISHVGEYYEDKNGNNTLTYYGYATDAAGNVLGQYTGLKSGLNTWANLSGYKDLQNWYAYDANANIQQSDVDLFFSSNLVFTAGKATNNIVLGASIDLGIGYVEFNSGALEKASFTVTADGGRNYLLNSSGVVINKGAEVHLQLTNPADYMYEWRKNGAGDLYIDGTGNTNALLNLGGTGTTYLMQKDGAAAYNVLANSGATVVINDINQIQRDFTFGNGGGTLDMNGNSMDWYTTNSSVDAAGFSINALTEEAIITNTSAGTISTLTYKQSGEQTYLGSFRDTKDAALRIDYQGDGTWTLHSIHTDLSQNENSGLVVSNGQVIFSGSNTVHGRGSAIDQGGLYLIRDNDWHNADATMNVQVKNGATFELGSHARLKGEVNVDNGGTFIMREGVKDRYEYVEGGSIMEDTYTYAEFYGLKGNVNLQGDMIVEYSEGTTTNTTFEGNISGSGKLTVKAGTTGGTLTLAGDNSGLNGAREIVSGGVIATTLKSLGNVSNNRWLIGQQGWLASHEFTDSTDILSFIDTASTGTLALSNDLSNQLNLNAHKGLFIGAETGKTVQYGTAGATLTAVDGAYRLGGGGGHLIVNFKLTGDETNLLLGADASSTGTVSLTNSQNDFGGTITFAGNGITLHAAEGALGNSTLTLTYGNALALSSKADISRLSAASDGMLLLDNFANTDINTGAMANIAIGSTKDLTYTGNLAIAEGASYRIGTTNGATLTLASALDNNHNLVVDAQGYSGGTVKLAGNDSYAGTITVQGNADSTAAGDITLAFGRDMKLSGVISLNNGATMDTAGHTITIENDIVGNGGNVVNSGWAGPLDTEYIGELVFHAADGKKITASADIAAPQIRKTGSGTLVLDATNTYSDIYLDEGKVVLGHESAASEYGTVHMANGTTLDLASYNLPKNTYLTSDSIIMEANAGTATIRQSGVSATHTSTIGGNVILGSGSRLNMEGSGIFYLNGKQFGGSGAEINMNAAQVTLGHNDGATIAGTISFARDSKLYSNGENHGVTRSIEHLNIASGSTLVLAERSTSYWNVDKLSGSGTLQWNSTTNHYDNGSGTASRLILKGENDFTGHIILNRNQEYANHTHGAYIELAHNQAAQYADITLTGRNAKGWASLAVNTDNATIKGLTGNSYSYTFAGAADNTILKDGAHKQSNRASILTINTDAGTSYTYAGQIGHVDDTASTGLSLVKQGEGTQAFTGTAVLGNVTVQGGTLSFATASTTVSGNISLGNGTLNGLNYTLGEGQMFEVTGTANFGGTLTLAGGQFSIDGIAFSNGSTALSLNSVTLAESSTQTITFTNALNVGEGTFTLATGNWAPLLDNLRNGGISGYDTTLNTNEAGNLQLIVSTRAGAIVWDGTDASHEWSRTQFGSSANALGENSIALFKDSAANTNVRITENISISEAEFTNVNKTYTVTADGGMATAGTLHKTGNGEVILDSGMNITGTTTIDAGTLTIRNGEMLNGAISGEGTLKLDTGADESGLSFDNLHTLQIASGSYGSSADAALSVRNIHILAGASYEQGTGVEYTGHTVLEGGTIKLNGGSLTGSMDVKTDSYLHVGTGLTSTLNLNLVQNDGAALIQTGGGTVEIYRYQNTGKTVLQNYVVQEGRLLFQGWGGHNNQGILTVKDGATLQVGWGAGLQAERINLESGSTLRLANGAGPNAWWLSNYVTADILVEDGANISGSVDDVGSYIQGTISGCGTLNLANDASVTNAKAYRIESTISDGTASLGLNIANTTVTFTGANTYSGGTVIDAASNVTTGNASALGLGAVQNAGRLTMDADLQLGGLSGAGALNTNGHTLELTNSSSQVYSGAVSGQGNLMLTGTGSTTFTSAVDFGSINVAAGQLSLSGATSIIRENVVVADGASLALGGAISMNGTIENAGSVYIAQNATFALQLQDFTNGEYTLVSGNGNVSYADTLTVNDFTVSSATIADLTQHGLQLGITQNSNTFAITFRNGLRDLTWTGSQSGEWNTTATNWKSPTESSMSIGVLDYVTFDNTATQKDITIAENTAAVYAMTVSGTDYNFTGSLHVQDSFMVQKGASVTLNTAPVSLATATVEGEMTLNFGGSWTQDIDASSGTINTTKSLTWNPAGGVLKVDKLNVLSGTFSTSSDMEIGTLALANSAYAMLTNNKAADAANKNINQVRLGNGADLIIDNKEVGTAKINIGELVLDGASAYVQDLNSGKNAFIGFERLSIAEGLNSANLTLYATPMVSAATTVYELGSADAEGGNFAGTIALTANLTHAAVVISGAEVAERAVIQLNASVDQYYKKAVGINADNVTIAGLSSASTMPNAFTLFSGTTASNQAFSTSSISNAATRTLIIDTAAGQSYTFYGEVLNGVNLTKTGAGAQAFSGKLGSAAVSVLGGTLDLTAATLANGALTQVALERGGTLKIGSLNLAEGTTLNISGEDMGQTAALSGSLTLNGGALSISGIGLNENTAALTVGNGITLGVGTQTITLTDFQNLEAGQSYFLIAGDFANGISADNFALSGIGESNEGVLILENGGLWLTLTGTAHAAIWAGTEERNVWDSDTFGVVNTLAMGSNPATFDDSASCRTVKLQGDVQAANGIVFKNNTESYTFELSNINSSLNTTSLSMNGDGSVHIKSALNAEALNLNNGTLVLSDYASLNTDTTVTMKGDAVLNIASTSQTISKLSMEEGTRIEDAHGTGTINLIAADDTPMELGGVVNVGTICTEGTVSLTTGDNTHALRLNGTDLTLNNAFTLDSGKTIAVLDNSSLNADITLAGGTLVFDSEVLSATTAALVLGKAATLASETKVNIEVSNLGALRDGGTFVLMNGDWSAFTAEDFTLTGKSYAADLATFTLNGNTLTMTLAAHAVWAGTKTDYSWNTTTFGPDSGLTENTVVIFDDSAANSQVALTSDVKAGALLFDNNNAYTVQASEAGLSIDARKLTKEGMGTLNINADLTLSEGLNILGGHVTLSGTTTVQDTSTQKNSTVTLSGNNSTLGDYNLTDGGTLNIAGSNISLGDLQILRESGAAATLNFTGGSATAESIVLGNTTSLNFQKPEGADSTTYNINGELAFTSVYGRDNTHVLVEKGVKLQIGSIRNPWGWGNFDIEGEVEVQGHIHMSSGTEDRFIGAGSLKAGSMTFANAGTYVFDMASVNVTGDINLNGGYATILRSGVFTSESKFKQSGSSFTLEGGELRLNGESSFTGGVLKLTGGTMKLQSGTTTISNTVQASGGSLILDGGNLELTATTAESLLEGLDQLTLNSGSLDLADIRFTSGNDNAISLKEGATFSFSGGIISLGDLQQDTTYRIFDATNGTLEGWDSLSLSNFIINGTEASKMGRVELILGSEGSFSYSKVVYDLVWTGAAGTNEWNTTDANWVVANGGSADIAYANGDSVTFASDAKVKVAPDTILNNLSLAQDVTLTTTGSIIISGDITSAKGSRWVLDGTDAAFTQSLNTKRIAELENLEVGTGATLSVDGTQAGYTASNISGTGTVELTLTSEYENSLRLEGFDGEVYVQSGRFDLYDATTGTDNIARLGSKLHLGADVRMQIEGSKNVVINADMQLDDAIQVHHNSGATLTVNGSVSGEADSVWNRHGGGTLTINGDVNLGKFDINANNTTNNFNGKASVGEVMIDTSNSVMTFAKEATLGTATIHQLNNTLSFNKKATIGTLNISSNAGSTNTLTVNVNDGGELNLLKLLTLTGENKTDQMGDTVYATINVHEGGRLNAAGGTQHGNLNVSFAANTTLGAIGEADSTVTFSNNMSLGTAGTDGTITIDTAATTADENLILTRSEDKGVTVDMTGNISLKGNVSLDVIGSGTLKHKSVFNNTAAIRVQEGASLAAESDITTAVELNKGSLQLNNASLKGDKAALSVNESGSIRATGGSNTVAANTVLGDGATITYDVAEGATLSSTGQLAARGERGNLVKLGEGTADINNAANAIANIRADAGELQVFGDASYDLQDLQAATSVKLSFYAGAEGATGPEASVRISGSATFGAGSTLNANLTMTTGSTLEVAEGGLAMGSTLTLQEGITLGEDTLERIHSLSVGEYTTLFHGVDGLTLGNKEYASITAEDSILAAPYFSNLESNYAITYTGTNDGSLNITMLAMSVPEPATATLSLLALAALAARRRRK